MKFLTPQIPDGAEGRAVSVAYNRLIRDLVHLFGAKVGLDNLAVETLTLNVVTLDPWTTVPAASFLNSWAANTVAPAYMKDGGDLLLRGLVSGGTLASAAFKVPSTHAPAATRYLAANANNSGTAVHGDLRIYADGSVTPYAAAGTTFFSLDGVRIPCADPTPIPNPCWPKTVVTTSKAPAVAVVVLAAADTGPAVSGGLPTGAGALPVLGPVDWTWQTGRGGGVGSVLVKNVPGLAAQRKYALTLVAVYG